MSDDEEEYGEIFTTFEGECTCEHEPDQHSWGSCGFDGCPCEAGWCE